MFRKNAYYLLITAILLFVFVRCSKPPEAVTPETALLSYLDNGDKTYSWKVVNEKADNGITVWQLLLTSQKWREFTWVHQLTILVPDKNDHDTALLFITGGSVNDGKPNWKKADDELVKQFMEIAKKNRAPVAVLYQVPNQPLYDGLVEDQLISYTLHNFKKDGDFTWPLLFPMVKSAVRAMDAIQAFSKEKSDRKIDYFVVSGGSKRGWTTWLTGAMDNRVSAIAPMVIDVLNMPVNLDYQLKVWDDYSVQIEDYVKLGIPQDVHTENGDAITKMVDPYSYREKLTMPKMIFIGTNDEYWPVDAIKYYLPGIPGKNFVHYVPNAGHDLGDKRSALRALSAFFGKTINHETYPVCSWKIMPNDSLINLTVEITPDELVKAELWSARSTDRDFRNDTWTSVLIDSVPAKEIRTEIPYPDSGYQAFYVDLEYTGSNGGTYTKSTRMFVADDNEVFVE